MPRAQPNSDAPLDPSALLWQQALRRRLIAWFRRSQRALPWRETRDPYAIWVSEIMLQQTQVATVIEYYKRFLAAFPTVAELAAAEEEQVLRLWEGLGYYRRARNLHRAAQEIVAQHQGVFPNDIETVRSLPGIGRYTAGAILSISQDQRLPILEANTVRLYSRLIGFRGDPRSGEGQRILWNSAESWLPKTGSGEFNQALMELGSLICTPQSPDCPHCPVAELCEARRQGLVDQIPLPAKKIAITAVRETFLVIRRRGRVLLLKNPDEGRWAGMWDFPRYPLTDEQSPESDIGEVLIELVRERLGMKILPGPRLLTLRHGVTRYRITLDCYEAQWISGPESCPLKGTFKWAEPGKLGEFPLSVTGRKLAKRLAEICSNDPKSQG